MKPKNNPRLSYTIAEAAAVTGLSRRTLYRNMGKLNVSKIGSRVLIMADSLQKMLEQGVADYVSSAKG